MDILDPFKYGARAHEMVHDLELMRKADSVAVIIISDLDLSDPLVTDRLKRVFSGYEPLQIELLFVLMGPFASKDFHSTCNVFYHILD